MNGDEPGPPDPPDAGPERRSSDDPTAPFDGAAGDALRVGPYRLLQKLGEGGMGEVWEAEQTEPVRRKVAVKFIKWGMDTRQVVARFEAERQALAMMSHPNVARVFDAGATERGRPYFVMELVKGVPITEHCDRQRLTTEERLELFVQVCDGVQHAHQKGIIHRDIKASNALVTIQDGKAVPKIIDFGIAKATEHKLTEQTVFTEYGELIGTPEYMSPEQTEMTVQDVDTRTDVYSLGVLLYELLAGALPFDPRELRRTRLDEMRRRVREEEPPRPSTRISASREASTESARKRHTDPRSLVRALRGDLDWITMRCLEKDRTRRYGSPSELAADIGRHLRHEPVVAGPPGFAYRAGKFLRRHRLGAGVAAAAVIVLLAFAVTTTIQSRRIAREARTSQRVSEFLTGMLADVDPEGLGRLLLEELREQAAARDGRAGEERDEAEAAASLEQVFGHVNATDAALRLLDEGVLGRAAETIEEELADEPLIAARLEHTVGRTYYKLGLYERAEPHKIRAAEIRERELGRDHPATLKSLHSVAVLFYVQGRYDEAESVYRDVLERQRRVLGPDHAGTLRSIANLGMLYDRQGRYDEAEPLKREALEKQKAVLGDDHPDTLNSMNALASLYSAQGRHDEAEALHRETLEKRRRVLGEDHPNTLVSMSNLVSVYTKQGRYGEAERLGRETLERQRRALGDDHAYTLFSMSNLARVYNFQGRYPDAEALHLETLERRRRALGDDHPRTLGSMADLAWMYRVAGRYDEAESLYVEALEGQRRVLGNDHSATLACLGGLAALRKDQQRFDEAEALYVESLEKKKRVLGDDHPDTLVSMNNLAALYKHQGRFDEAEALHLEILGTRRRSLGEEHPHTLFAINALAGLYAAQGRHDEAEPLFREALETRKRVLGENHTNTLASMSGVAWMEAVRGRYAEAESLYREVYEKRKRLLGSEHRFTLGAMSNLGWLYTKQGRHEEAGSLLRQVLEARTRTLGESHPDVSWSYYLLACLSASVGRRDDAFGHLNEALKRGWADTQILVESELDSLRGDPEFEAIVAEVRKRLRPE